MQHIVIRGAQPYGLPLKYKIYPNILRRWAIKHTLWANGIRASIKRITYQHSGALTPILATGPVMKTIITGPALKTTWVLTLETTKTGCVSRL